MSWRATGWTNGRNIEPMLDFLWTQGAVTVAGRDVERHFTIGRYPGLDLEHAGWARPVRVEGGSEQWWVHRDTLGLLDQERLWDFVYRNESYVPKHKRRFGSN